MVSELELNKVILKKPIYSFAHRALTEAHHKDLNHQIRSPLCLPYAEHIQFLYPFLLAMTSRSLLSWLFSDRI